MISAQQIEKLLEENKNVSEYTTPGEAVFSLNEQLSVLQAFSTPVQEVTKHPNDRFKAIHFMDLKKDPMFRDAFEDRPYIKMKIEPLHQDFMVKFNFNGATVSYRQNKYGAISFAIVFKSHKDVYNKRIGFSMASVVLDKYLLVDDSEVESLQLSFTDSYDYDAIVGTIPNIVLKSTLTQALPPHALKKFTVADMCNGFINDLVKSVTAHLLLQLVYADQQVDFVEL